MEIFICKLTVLKNFFAFVSLEGGSKFEEILFPGMNFISGID